MLNIDGMSQVEIEEMFSKEQLSEYMSIELANFLEQLGEKDYKLLSTHVDNPIDVMLKLIAFLGDTNIGHRIDTGERRIELEYMMSFCSTLFEESNYNNKMEKAIELIADFDTILYDLEQNTRLTEDGGYYTETSLLVGFDIGQDSKIQEYQNLVRFRLPMIEKPKPHTIGNGGGYELESGKSVLNKGEQIQPQNCLDVLNTLQNNAYIMNDVCYSEERVLIMDKLQSNNWKYPMKSDSALLEENELKCDIIMKTTHETYTAMKDKTMYFAWKFDMRGRMYSVGYDLNLQASKYKKATLKAI